MCLQYDGKHGTKLQVLKREAKMLIASTSMKDGGDELLKLIDTIQRLGIAYHFEKEIEEALHLLYEYIPTDLHHTALHFRLLRDNGFSINSGISKRIIPFFLYLNKPKKYH